MAEFLTLQGHDVPLEVESGAEVDHPQDHVDRQRTFGMRLVEQERADEKRVWRATTCVLTPLEARAYRALITGNASRVAFDEDVLSSRGLAPKIGSNFTHTAGAEGLGFATVAAGDSLTYAAGLGNRWTVLATMNAGTINFRCALTSAGICFLLGSEANESDENNIRLMLSVSLGDVAVAPVIPVDVYDLEWWHEVLTDDMLADMTAADAVESDLPFVEASGSYLEHDTVTVRGVVLSEEEVVALIDGVEYPNARRLSLELYEQEVEEVIAAPTISYEDVSASVGDPISVTPAITGDYDTIEVASGTLPDGATLNADGTITGAEYLTEQTVSVVVRISGPGGVSRHEVTFTVAAAAAGFTGGNISYGSVLEAARAMVAADDTAAPGSTAGGTLTLNGVALGDYSFHKVSGAQVVSAFDSADWFTTTEDSESAWVIVDGDLTINAGQVFKPANRKLFTVLYVTGDLVVNGEVSMSARGANHGAAAGNVAAGAILIASGTYSGVVDPEVPAAGGAGAAGATATVAAGDTGTAGSAGGTGGGGAGGAVITAGPSSSGSGAAGTSYSGGAGGGAITTNTSADAGDGGPDGGAGGDAHVTFTGDRASGGGAGNPGGAAATTGAGVANAGDDGTGGVLIVVYEGAVSGSGLGTADGAPGGDATVGSTRVGGAGSGGGHVTFLGGSGSGPTVQANGGAGAAGAGRAGGNGGAGTARLLTGLTP